MLILLFNNWMEGAPMKRIVLMGVALLFGAMPLKVAATENLVSGASNYATAMTKATPGTEQLSSYFTAETPVLQSAGIAKLTAWNLKNQEEADKIHAMVRAMADDGVVTSDEFYKLKDALKLYDDLVSHANEDLAIYRMKILQDERVEAYYMLFSFQQDYVSFNAQKQNIRRFFLNLTGKDVRIKLGTSDKLGRAFGPALVLGIVLFALL